MKTIQSLILLVFTLALPAIGADISLDNVPVQEEKTSISVGYVDVSVLFEEHPMTVRLKEAFIEEANKKKEAVKELQDKVLALEDIQVSSATETGLAREELEALKKSETELSSSTDTIRIKGLRDDIKKRENKIKENEKAANEIRIEIEKQRAAISELRRKNKEELSKLEDKDTQIVMADIYLVIEEVAKEENLNVILDKNDILYGKSAKNVTEKVLQRLRGR